MRFQETLGCSVNTPNDVVNEGGKDASANPTCFGNYRYVRCLGMTNAAAPLPLEGATLGFSAPRGWCLNDEVTEDECALLCDALAQSHAAAPGICGGYDYAPASGLCCVNPTGPGVFLKPASSPTAVHSVKVAVGHDWACPVLSPAACPANNTAAACAGYSGPAASATVGHDFVVAASTHADGRRAVTLLNFDTSIAAAPTVVLPGATTYTTAEPGKLQLFEVDPVSGEEIAAVDDVPTLPGLQISLDVAEARLFLIGAAPKQL